MIWFKVLKHSKPKHGKYYWDWKAELSIEGKHQCVYCAVIENAFGGIRNFHVEHYRPKSINRFKKLEHDYSNLFYACSICNCFKGDDWPNEPNKALNVKCYPNPTKIDYCSMFTVKEDFDLEGSFFAARYMIEKLFLNRPQLKLERRAFSISQELKDTFNQLKEIVDNFKKKPAYKKGVNKILVDALIKTIDLNILQNKERYVIPYAPGQTKKSPKRQ